GTIRDTNHSISANGLTVACCTFSLGSPHFSQLLVVYHFSDMAWPASSVEWPPLFAEIPMLCSDWLKLSADSARFPPFAISLFAPCVVSLVVESTNSFVVFD